MKQLATLTWKEFADRFRSGWVIACALVWLGAVSLTSLFGLLQIGKIGWQGYERTVVSLLNLVQYFVPLLGLLLGHDLIVGEREEKTLSLIVSGGVPRSRVLLGKFLGGCLTLALPLLLGFLIAGTAIGIATEDGSVGPFARLALSGLVLGVIFLGLGLLVSILCRTRVQALVVALLAWGTAVFVFDLAAMGVLVVSTSSQAAREVETVTSATHVNAVADMHAAFENGDDAAARASHQTPKQASPWLLLNPVDLFRTINLPKELAPTVPVTPATVSVLLWLAGCLGTGCWKLNRIDL